MLYSPRLAAGVAELELANAVGDEQRRAAHCTFTVAGAGLPDPMSSVLTGQEGTGQYLSGDDAWQMAARLVAHDQEGWQT
jgi:hypothetical protein